MQSTCDLPEAKLPNTKEIFARNVAFHFDLCFATNSGHRSPGVSQSAPRPEKGTYIRYTQLDGMVSFTIHNNWTMDTVAVLTDPKSFA